MHKPNNQNKIIVVDKIKNKLVTARLDLYCVSIIIPMQVQCCIAPYNKL